MMSEYDYLFKFALIGDAGVGKSNLLLKYVDDTYTDSYISTIGYDSKAKQIELDGKRIKLQLWDTAGQDRFRGNSPDGFRGQRAYILVFDLTDQNSFNKVKEYLNECQRYASQKTILILVGNKSDLENRREVSQEQIDNFVAENKIPYFEASAKTGKGVDNIFETTASLVKQALYPKTYENNNQPVLPTVKSNQNSWWCCLFPFLNKKKESDDVELKQKQTFGYTRLDKK